MHLTGLKIACGQGGCGACTVMVSFVSSFTKNIHHVAVNSCLLPVCAVHGMAVTTVEGLGSVKNGMHPVQVNMFPQQFSSVFKSIKFKFIIEAYIAYI